MEQRITHTICYSTALVTLLIGLSVMAPSLSIAQPLAAGQETFLGCGTSSFLFRNLDQYWNQVSPGNDGKWGSVENPQGVYNWSNLDKIYSYAVGRNLLYKHHTLVWGSQQPGWLGSLDSATQRSAVVKWMQAVSARYPKMAMVDVVNEPLHTPLPVYKQALGGDGATGWDWVITAFQLARASMPAGAKLLLNDYNILSSTTTTTNYLAIINLLKDRGLIDGIGVQGHYFEFRSEIGTAGGYVYDIPTMKANLDRLTATGLPVYITEFDIDEQLDANQLSQYQIYFPIFWNNPGVKGITFWGYIQNDIWTTHPYTYLLLTDGTERPAMQWLRTYIVSPRTPAPVFPVAITGISRNVRLQWRHSDSTLSYRVQLTTNRSFATILQDTTCTDTTLWVGPLNANTTYYWRVSASNVHGTSEYSATSAFTTGDQLTAVTALPLVPSSFTVSQNYPNPFNPSTVIRYELSAASRVSIAVYDLIGREVATLIDGEQEAGYYSVTFDAGRLPNGMYVYRVQAGGHSMVRKMLLVK